MNRDLKNSPIYTLDWGQIHQTLDDQGFAKLPVLLTPEQCQNFINLYDQEELYRNTINMGRYCFGEGEYKYFDYPLPALLQELRTAFYPELAIAANRWLHQLGKEAIYPDSLDVFLEECHEKEQTRSTPLILKYEAGGYNCMHQDLYGDVYFPFQVVFTLNQRGVDYTGGESILVEQRPRAQSRGHVITLEQGEALLFPTNHRPVEGKKGYYKNTMRHGVSTLQSGIRYGMGIIFHDAK
ncbi:2OG-Fe(II) oxygenase [Peribacillus sp. R9-11]|uniref:2OG-Fe(II) oxygenase n=1 Tax=Peribacillus sp. R9-11 TaxID=3073271 RepID=UPI002868494C|nr:2OG-Fe(II) oxygenase [Peribacillus sp. R9-11]WMX54708.1 2OG-Fe(II) oxygenase [Peribacillus sp. R9-11]